jgi:7,8-dihydropterin-6-yl-methyl-4-(beta-D-ribofuranosyl)aminobenzene 5'-phosphate synthase
MNPVEIAALDALDLLVVVDNESDTLSSVDKGVPQLPELGRLVARVPHLAPKDGPAPGNTPLSTTRFSDPSAFHPR